MPPALHRDIDEEILQRTQQERTKPAALRIGGPKKIPLHYHEEKILGKVLGIGFRITATVNEGEDWPPINVAKLDQRRIDLARTAMGRVSLAEETPPRRNKMGERSRTLDSSSSSHASSVNGRRLSLKHKIPCCPAFTSI
jgi:hypothetical protein